ncbi:MAG: hypothetical protein RSF02_00275 [Bacilli bacterium]
MYNIIERYMAKLTIEDINNFAISKNANLSEDELKFTYDFLKKNWKEIIKNPNIFNIDRYKDKYSKENFIKIKQLYLDYFNKFAAFL